MKRNRVSLKRLSSPMKFETYVHEFIYFQFPVVELSEEQKQMIILSDDFQRFVLKSGRIMERALWEQGDIYTDYIGGGDVDETA